MFISGLRVILFFAFLSNLVYSQPSNWKFQNPYPDGESNYAIDAVGNNVYVCGLFGKTIKSTDAGLTWKKPEWHTVRNFFAIDFIDENKGIVGGGNGDIFRTTNAGENWIRLYPSDLFLIEDIEFINSQEVVAVGRRNKIIYSGDSGETWSTVNLPIQCWLKGVSFNKNGTGLVCGVKDSSGVIFRSIDTGKTWQQVLAPLADMRDIHFVNDSLAFAAGDHIICKTTDGGITWQQYENYNLPWYIYYNSISFADDSTGIVVGTYGLILRTTNYGATWVQVQGEHSVPYNSFNMPDLESVKFCNASTGYIAGTFGTILKTTDAGLTWKSLSSGNTSQLTAVEFTDTKNGFASGGAGTLLTTTNGGQNWIEKNTVLDRNFTLLKVLNNQHIIVAGTLFSQFSITERSFAADEMNTPKHSMSVAQDSGMCAVTFDGGDTWSTSSFGDELLVGGIDFFNDLEGLLVAFKRSAIFPPPPEDMTAQVFKTNDGGLTWNPLSVITASEVFYPLKLRILPDSKIIVMGEYGLFYVSTDFGNTWNFLSQFEFHSTTTSFSFLDNSNGFASSMNGIFKTTDGGKTWDLIYNAAEINARINSVKFYDNNNGFAVGEGVTGPNYCLIMRTTDGGANWTFEYPPTVNSLNDIAVVSPDIAYAVGAGGTILTNADNMLHADDDVNVLNGFRLYQNFPNPFNPSTKLNYKLGETANVIITVYDILGREVSVLVNEEQPAGFYSVSFNAGELSSGVYFYSIRAGSFKETNKMILVR